MDRQPEHEHHLGQLTLADITDTRDFLATPEVDAWGVTRRPFSLHIARMSAELAADGYDLDLKPWMRSGWEDCTFIVEDRIVVLDHEGDSRLAALEGGWKLRRARSLIRGVNLVSDLTRAIRQLMVTDLGKAIVMTRLTPDGQVIIAISFIGTTQKYFDWFTNFKFQQKTGMHHGFLALAEQFSLHTPKVLLPKLAAAMGEESYTLADAILDSKKPDSPIVFWISGHSQGGAIVQTYTHLLLSQGVPACCVHAYTFAAPTVAALGADIDPRAYPIHHVINTDDVVPRVGAQVRLGTDWAFRPTQSFRQKHYRVDKDLEHAFDRMLFGASRVQTTQQALCWGIGFLRAVQAMEDEGELESLLTGVFPFLPMLRRVNLNTLDILAFFLTQLESQLQSLTGAAPDGTLVAYYEEGIRALLRELGAKDLALALVRVLGSPHRIRPEKGEEDFVPPYAAIVCRHMGQCTQGVWQQDEPARCLAADGTLLYPLPWRQRLLPTTAIQALPEGEPNPPAQA